jgi:ABC-type multidrug transport system ATPase subunit
MPAAVEVHGLVKRFGRLRALDGLDLRVEEGKIVGLLGENGAGKTTAIGCLLGLLRPDKGWASVLGEDSSRFPRVARRVGVSFENPSLHPSLTGRGNLEVAWRLAGRPAGRSPADVEALLGLGPHARRRAGRYSRGLQQRLSLARALLGRPLLLVLDEPLNGLDPLGVEAVLDLLAQLQREEGITILVSSHDLLEFERIYDEVVLVRDGRVLAAGSLEALLLEGDGSVEVVLDRPEEALEWLRRHEAVRETRRLETGAIEVALAPGAAARVNGDLVRAGFAVSAFAPRRRTLADFYREAVRRSA